MYRTSLAPGNELWIVGIARLEGGNHIIAIINSDDGNGTVEDCIRASARKARQVLDEQQPIQKFWGLTGDEADVVKKVLDDPECNDPTSIRSIVRQMLSITHTK